MVQVSLYLYTIFNCKKITHWITLKEFLGGDVLPGPWNP